MNAMTDDQYRGVYAKAPADPVAWVASLGLELTIDGADTRAAGRGRIVDPVSGAPGARYPDSGVGHVDLAVAAAKRAFPGWAATQWSARRAALERFADLLVEQRALDIDEHTPGVSAIGTAFLDSHGRPYAISIPIPSARFAEKRQVLEARLLESRGAAARLTGGR